MDMTDPCSASAVDCIPMRLISMDLMLSAFHVISAFFRTCCHRTYPFPTGLQIYPWPLHWITSPQVHSSLGPSKYYECLQAQFHPNLQRYHKRMPDFFVQQPVSSSKTAGTCECGCNIPYLASLMHVDHLQEITVIHLEVQHFLPMRGSHSPGGGGNNI